MRDIAAGDEILEDYTSYDTAPWGLFVWSTFLRETAEVPWTRTGLPNTVMTELIR